MGVPRGCGDLVRSCPPYGEVETEVLSHARAVHLMMRGWPPGDQPLPGGASTRR